MVAPTDGAKSKTRRWLLVALAALLLACGFLPTLLSTGLLRPLLQATLRQALGVPVLLGDADLAWRGPCRFSRIEIASPPGFGSQPLAFCEEATLDTTFTSLLFGTTSPESITLSRPSVTLVKAPDGKSNLQTLFEDRTQEPLQEFLTSGTALSVQEGTLAVTDRKTGDTSWLKDIFLQIQPDPEAGNRTDLKIKTRTEGPGGEGYLLGSISHQQDGSARLMLVARNLNLAHYSPAFAAVVQNGNIAGLVNMELDTTIGPGPRIELYGKGSVRNLSLVGKPWIGERPLYETAVEIQGSAIADLEEGSVSFDNFHLASSAIEITGNGELRCGGDPLHEDAFLKASANFDYLVQRFHSLMMKYVPLHHISGDTEVRITPAESGGFHLVSTSENLMVGLTRERSLNLGLCEVAGSITYDPQIRQITVKGGRVAAIATSVEGDATFGLARDEMPWTLNADLVVRSHTDYLNTFLQKALAPLPTFADGIVNANISLHADGDSSRGNVHLESEAFGVTVQIRESSYEDEYEIRGTPLTLDARWTMPRTNNSVAASDLEALNMSFALDAPAATIDQNELQNLTMAGHLRDGTLVLEEANGVVNGGHFEARGQYTLFGDRPHLELHLAGEDIGVEGRFPGVLAATLMPVFAASPGTWAVNNSIRMSGSLDVEAHALGMTPALAVLNGTGSITFSSGEVGGSPLLEQLTEPYGVSGTRQVETMSNTIRILDGSIVSSPSFTVNGRTFRLDGEADTFGRFRYNIPANQIFAPPFFKKYVGQIPSGMFSISGRYDRPELVVPDREKWARMASEGHLDELIQKLGEP